MWIPNWLGLLRYSSVGLRRASTASRRRSRLTVSAEVLEQRIYLSAAPVIDSLTLQNDTGDPGDGITEDPTITGVVVGTGDYFDIEIDLDGDGIAEDFTATDPSGSFVYDPGINLSHGEVTIFVRAGEWDGAAGYVYSEWASITFTYTSTGSPLAIGNLSLQNDTGDPGDLTTADPTITGEVINGNSTSLDVEFDFDGDGVADENTTTDSSGRFVYDPSLYLSYGQVTIFVRGGEWDGGSGYVYSEWASITFTYSYSSSTLAIGSLGLENDTGDPVDLITEDPTLTGNVIDGSGTLFDVEFDFDGDGNQDSITTTDSSGHFVYDPRLNLSYGEVTIFVRAGEWDGVSEYIYSEWVSITFTFDRWRRL